MRRRFNSINLAFLKNEVTDKTFDKSKISSMTTDYKLRTYTAGCYYLDEKYEEWTGLNAKNNIVTSQQFNKNVLTGRGMSVLNTSYEVTTCLSSHMTLFGGGFFIQPNSLDFDFIFAESDFSVSIL